MAASRCHKRTYTWNEARRRLQHPPHSATIVTASTRLPVFPTDAWSHRYRHRSCRHCNRRPPERSPPLPHHHARRSSRCCIIAVAAASLPLAEALHGAIAVCERRSTPPSPPRFHEPLAAAAALAASAVAPHSAPFTGLPPLDAQLASAAAARSARSTRGGTGSSRGATGSAASTPHRQTSAPCAIPPSTRRDGASPRFGLAAAIPAGCTDLQRCAPAAARGGRGGERGGGDARFFPRAARALHKSFE